MTLSQALETKRPFKRPHWRASMRYCPSTDKIRWTSSGDVVESFVSYNILATDYISAEVEKDQTDDIESLRLRIYDLQDGLLTATRQRDDAKRQLQQICQAVSPFAGIFG